MYKYLFKSLLSGIPNIDLGVQLLCHMVALHLIIWENINLVSKVVASLNIP